MTSLKQRKPHTRKQRLRFVDEDESVKNRQRLEEDEEKWTLEFNERRPPFKDDDTSSVHTTLEDYNPAIHHPVFYGKMHEKISAPETNIANDVDTAICHPSIIGHTLIDRPPKSPAPPPPPLPDLKTCSPREYLEAYIFPVLLPALEDMLRQAKLEKCFERKRTKFNGCDFLTEYLYNHNPKYEDRETVELGEIPFVAEHWKLHPRPPLPMSLLWTEEEATLIIQSHFRGYKARLDPEIQDLRRWQREWREENANIKLKVDDFWAKQMPDGDVNSPRQNEEGQQDEETKDEENDETQQETEANQSNEASRAPTRSPTDTEHTLQLAREDHEWEGSDVLAAVEDDDNIDDGDIDDDNDYLEAENDDGDDDD